MLNTRKYQDKFSRSLAMLGSGIHKANFQPLF